MRIQETFRSYVEEASEMSESGGEFDGQNFSQLDISTSSVDVDSAAQVFQNVTAEMISDIAGVRESLASDEIEHYNDWESEPQMTTIDEVDESGLSEFHKSTVLSETTGLSIDQSALFYGRFFPGKVLSCPIWVDNRGVRPETVQVEVLKGVHISRQQAAADLLTQFPSEGDPEFQEAMLKLQMPVEGSNWFVEERATKWLWKQVTQALSPGEGQEMKVVLVTEARKKDGFVASTLVFRTEHWERRVLAVGFIEAPKISLPTPVSDQAIPNVQIKAKQGEPLFIELTNRG